MDIAALYDEIRHQVRGCPEPTLRTSLLRAARTLASESWLLRRTYSFSTVVGTQRYDITNPDNEETFAIRHASIAYPSPNNSAWPLRIVYPTTMNPNAGPAAPHGICLVPYTQVALDCPPDQIYDIVVEILTQPIANTNVIPDELGVRYRQGLGYGALEWLHMQRGNPWFDPSASAYNRTLFNQEIVKARGEAAFDFSPGPREWIQNPLARTGYGSIW